MITEESFIDFKCPHCGEPVSFPKENAGFAQACPNCTESLIVPDDGSEVGWEIPLPITTPGSSSGGWPPLTGRICWS